jgi:hypothetical protein
MNNGASMPLSIFLNWIMLWAVAASPLVVAEDKASPAQVLPTMPTNKVAIRKIHWPIVSIAYSLLIDAIHRLAYPLAQRLEGIASATGIKEGDNTNGL